MIRSALYAVLLLPIVLAAAGCAGRSERPAAEPAAVTVSQPPEAPAREEARNMAEQVCENQGGDAALRREYDTRKGDAQVATFDCTNKAP
jgi:putative hemolysin